MNDTKNVYMVKGSLYHEECMDEQDKVSATLVKLESLGEDDSCEECGKDFDTDEDSE